MVPINECPVICHGLVPVICRGLVSSSHLNRELGEVKEITHDGSGIRIWVYFEKKGVKSALVKPEKLHIAFELPSNK